MTAPRDAPLPAGTDPVRWGIADLHQAYAQGRADPLSVTRACLDRVAQLDPALRAFIHVAASEALSQAAASAARWAKGRPLGLLDGVPVALKDNIEVAGMPCTAGTAAFAARVPARHAPAWEALADAGAVMLGKLNMHEAALGATTDNPVYGRCINPLRAGYTPGGSSGGSAAAVAGHLCAAALGTDTMGSVRIPAAYCGLYGFIPSRGTVSLEGIVPLSPTLDTVGPMARSGHDLACIASALLRRPGPVPAPALATWEGLRVGWFPQMQAVEMAPGVRAAWEATYARLQARGALLRPVHLPEWEPARLRLDALLMSEWEGAAYWLAALGPGWPGLGPDLVKMLRYGHNLDPARRQRAQDSVMALRALAARCFDEVDVVMLPTTPHCSFPHDQPAPASQADFAALANAMGVPALSFPCPIDAGPGSLAEEALPASCQFLAAPGGDDRLLALAPALDSLWD